MQTTWSRPVVEVVVFSNEGLRKVVNAMLYLCHTGLTVALSARDVRALDPGVITVSPLVAPRHLG